jgi:PAS domain S-box-containing protein
MYESLISACNALDSFGLPRAVGNLLTDRFIAANESFLRLTGLEKDEIAGVSMSEIVVIQKDSSDPPKVGHLVPIIIRSPETGITISGQAAIGSNDLALLMVQTLVNPNADFESGTLAGKEMERQQIASYVHENLTPEFMSAIYSMEAIRAQLEKEGHHCAAQLKDLQGALTQPVQKMGKELRRAVIERQEFDLLARRLAAIVEDSDDAIISKDLNGIVKSWNQGAERIFGYSADEMIGSSIKRIIPQDRQSEEDEILARLRRGERYGHFETIRVAKDGRQLHVSVTISPIKGEGGKILGASKITRDITERNQVQEALRGAMSKIEAVKEEKELLLEGEHAARLEAERLGRIKDEFLTTIGHGLRTPLHAILEWTTLLRLGRAHDHQTDQALEAIERTARAQAQIVNDLLDVGGLISGKVRLDVQPVDLATIIEEALETIRPAASAKGVHLEPTIRRTVAQISGDPNRLQQVFWNLLSNAIKFTPRGGNIQVLFERVDSQVKVSVTDTGIGISAEFLPRIFDRFQQADSSTTRRQEGLGLGLSIVKHLVELHGGTVEAKREGIGNGSTFTVSFPLTH